VIFKSYPYILAYKSLPRISRPPEKRVPVWSKIIDPRISRRWSLGTCTESSRYTHMHFRSCTISIVRSALTSHLNWVTVQQYEPWWQSGEGQAAGRTDGGGQMSIEARSFAGVRGVYPGTRLRRRHNFVGNSFHRSAGETSVYCLRRPTAQCPVLS